jgi:diguanylate cyclase (GGDEF)-like protein
VCLEAISKKPQEAEDQMILPPGRKLQIDKGSNDIYLIAGDKDAAAARKMSDSLQQFGYATALVNDLEAFADAYKNQFLKSVIIYSSLAENDLKHIQSIVQTNAAIPVIIVSPYDDFEARLSAARLGAQGYFSGSIDTLKLIEKIETMSAKFAEAPDYRVLIVDDDEMLAEFYSHSLQRAGMKTFVVNNPRDAVGVIEQNDINLVLVDFQMPGCNGKELAAVIRQYDRYLRLPIVFITSQEDIESLLINTGLGIDDFLIKPFTPMHLISVVKSRAQRAEDLNSLMVRDSFTGLINHAHFNEILAQEVLNVKRKSSPSCYAILDIDHFKSINDTYGHQAGDQVLKTLTRMLQQHLRRTDVVGRCGGEEFGVLLPSCNIENAQQSIENLRQKVTESFFDIPGHKLRVTFSAGLVEIDGRKNADELIKRADKALYAAKEGGRNQIAVAENAL